MACQATPKQQEKNAPPPPAPVVLETIEADRLLVERNYLGEVRPNSDAALSASESGRVRKVHVTEGDHVEAGQLLVELDDRLARAEWSEAITAREQAEIEKGQAAREAQRFEALEREAIVSSLEAEREEDEAVRLEAQVAGVSAQVKVRSERLARHRVVAPFDGVVAQRLVDPGDWLTAGQPAIQLLTPGRVEVLVRVPGGLLDQVASLGRVELRTKDRTAKGQLEGVVNALDPKTRTALLRIQPLEHPAWLRAGSSVDVVFFVEQSGGVVVSRDALVYGVGGIRVIKVVDQKAVPVTVEKLATSNTKSLVAGELKLGDAVVRKGNERLRPGQAVRTDGAMDVNDPPSPSSPTPSSAVAPSHRNDSVAPSNSSEAATR